MIDIIFNILFGGVILGLSFWWVNVHEKYNNQNHDKE